MSQLFGDGQPSKWSLRDFSLHDARDVPYLLRHASALPKKLVGDSAYDAEQNVFEPCYDRNIMWLFSHAKNGRIFIVIKCASTSTCAHTIADRSLKASSTDLNNTMRAAFAAALHARSAQKFTRGSSS